MAEKKQKKPAKAQTGCHAGSLLKCTSGISIFPRDRIKEQQKASSNVGIQLIGTI